jgi:RNA polymerase sigma-70 factor (subfamily 1)
MGSDDPFDPSEADGEHDPDDQPDLSESMELARKAQGGDRAALEALVARYYERVLAMVRKRLGGNLRSGVESGDIVQDAMLNAASHFDEFEVRSHAELVGWFARVVENAIHSARRRANAQKRDRQREISLQDLAGPADDSQVEFQPAGDDGPPDQAIELREEDQRVRKAMGKLEPSHRRVLELHIEEELPWAEIADRLELSSPDAARMLYVRARLLLLRELG